MKNNLIFAGLVIACFASIVAAFSLFFIFPDFMFAVTALVVISFGVLIVSLNMACVLYERFFK